MKFNQVVKRNLKFTSPAGKQGRVTCIEKDLRHPPKWIGNVDHYAWIVTAKIDGELINMQFGYDDNLKAVKYNHEDNKKWRGKL